MDGRVRHRRKKFSSISSILSSSSSSSSGGSKGGLGCRVRLPIYSCSFVKGSAHHEEEEDDGDGEIKGMEVVSFKQEEKRGEELKIDSDSACQNIINGELEQKNCYLPGTEITNKISVSSSDKKGEDASLNLNVGMGVGLVLLLSKSTTELSRMVQLRKEMETLLLDLKNEINKKHNNNNNNVPATESTDNSNNAPSAVSLCTDHSGASNHTDVHVHGRLLDKTVVEMEDMEAELELELKRLQLTEETSNLPPLLIRKIQKTSDESGYLTDNLYDEQPTEGEGEIEGEGEGEIHNHNHGEEDDDDAINGDHYDDFNNGGGVNPHELERRLNEVLQSRQRERIEELECALECAKSKLYEREKEICWWQDTARLVTLHNDDSRYYR